MRIGIIGPNKIEEFCKLIKIDKKEYEKKLVEIAKIISKHELVLTPDKNSVSEFIAKEYKKEKGKKIYGIIPKDDSEFGYNWLNIDIIDEEINCKTWRNQPEKLDEESDILICLGLTPGSLVEIAYTKWFKVKEIFIIKEFISQKLPIEINKKLNIDYLSINDLKKRLK